MTGSATPGNQDRPASRVRPGEGQAGVYSAARRRAAADAPYYVGYEAEGQQIGLGARTGI